jgi:hypothetical protein
MSILLVVKSSYQAINFSIFYAFIGVVLGSATLRFVHIFFQFLTKNT